MNIEFEDDVEGVTEIAAVTSKMFEAIGVGIGIVGIGIVGVVHEMSSRGGEASGAAASGPKGSGFECAGEAGGARIGNCA